MSMNDQPTDNQYLVITPVTEAAPTLTARHSRVSSWPWVADKTFIVVLDIEVFRQLRLI